jgi:hypothetical protein
MTAERFDEALGDFDRALGHPAGPLVGGLRERLAQLAGATAPLELQRLTLCAAQVAAVRAVTAEVLPALAALQRSAQLRHLETGDPQAGALEAALDLNGQMIRNCLSLLKELPLGAWPAAQADALLWNLALHGQMRCTRGREHLPADGHALANLASSLQMLDRSLQRHGNGRPRASREPGELVVAAYQQSEPLDGVQAGLDLLGACGQFAQWLQACATGGGRE